MSIFYTLNGSKHVHCDSGRSFIKRTIHPKIKNPYFSSDLCGCSTLLQVFMSADEPDAGSQETPSGEDSSPTMTTLVPSAALPQEERPLVEFDSPDSGLPSSRNYSVTSAHSQILSSIDDGQSAEEEGRSGGVLGGRQDSLTEDRLCSQLDKLVTNGAAADGIPPSLSSYTVRTETPPPLI